MTDSQNKRVLQFLKKNRGGGMTQDDAEYNMKPRIKRLASRIYDLKCMGHEIHVEIQKVGDTRFARYFLIKERANG